MEQIFSGGSGVSSGAQTGPVSTLPGMPMPGFLNIPAWQAVPTYAVYAEVIKDSRKLILKLAKDGDNVARWLKSHVGSPVTTYVPQFGVAWTSTLTRRRRSSYLYVRIPSRLRRLFEPIWKAGYPIPVIISIPPISLTPPQGNKPVQG